MIFRLVVCAALAISTLQAIAAESLPAGTSAKVRLKDYADSEQQPLGYTFRGTVEGNISVEGKIVVQDKSKVLMRLVAAPQRPGGLTVEWWAVKLGEEWSEFRTADGQKVSFTVLKKVDDMRAPSPGLKPLMSSGARLYIPYNSVLYFELQETAHFQNVGSYRP